MSWVHSFLGDDAAKLATSSCEEPRTATSSRRRRFDSMAVDIVIYSTKAL